MNVRRGYPLLPLLPVCLGAGAEVLLWRVVPTAQLYVRSSLVLVVAEAGLIGSLGIALAMEVRRRLVSKRGQAALDAADLVREEHRRFLRRLDHELKNPLTAVRAGLANLAAAWPPDTVAPPALQAVDAQAVRLYRLVADLRKLAEVADRPIERVPVDLGRLLVDVAAAASRLPDGANRQISVSVPRAPWPLPPVLGDEDLLELALWNLVTNSVKYSADGAAVELRGFEENGQVIVEVADTGVGITPEEAPYVWDELVRGTAAQGVPGAGLGLPLVRTIVARHGGDCELRSQPGAGTAVRIRLSACPKASGGHAAPDVSKLRHQRHTPDIVVR